MKTTNKPLAVLCAFLVALTSFLPTAQALADSSPPVIELLPLGPVVEGQKDVRLDARITDADGIAQALILISTLSDGNFVSHELQTDNQQLFSYTFDPAELKHPGIDYYITAKDNTDREQSRGFEFDPLRLDVELPIASSGASAEDTVSTIEVKKKSNTLWYVVGGIAAIGLAAALAGGGGSNDSDGDGTSNEPVAAVLTFQ